MKNDPRCVCGHLFEDAIHFFLECPLYQDDRTSLFNYFNNIVPISIEYILFGCNEISEELNTLLFKSVQKFIRHTCRFNNYLSPTVILSQHNLLVLPPPLFFC